MIDSTYVTKTVGFTREEPFATRNEDENSFYSRAPEAEPA